MDRSDLLAIVEQLCDLEIDTLERDELADVVAATARVRGWLDATELRCTRRNRKLADAGRAEPAPSMIARKGNRSSREAEQINRRDKAAEAMPTFEDGLDDGTVSAGHLDAIANATRNASPEVRAAFAAHENELLALAVGDTVEVFTRRCRALVAQLTAELTGNDAVELDRQRAASHIRRWVNPEDGMRHTHVALDPLRDEILWNAINRHVRRRQQIDGNARTPWNQIQVDGLIDAVQGGAPDHSPTARRRNQPAGEPTSTRGGAPSSPAADIARQLSDAIERNLAAHGHSPSEMDFGWDDEPGSTDSDSDDDIDSDDDDSDSVLRRIEQRIPEVSLLVDLAFLIDRLRTAGICETEDGVPLPVSTVRRLCCDAEIIPAILGTDGELLELGRTVRTVNRSQRRALRAMHRTCINPDCSVPFSHTKIHHVRFWVRDQGPTDIDNLVPLCERCHHLVHEGGWTLTMTPDRIATWTRPDGTLHHRGSCIDRRPSSGTPPSVSPATGSAPPGSAPPGCDPPTGCAPDRPPPG
jgi:hypothetical protein